MTVHFYTKEPIERPASRQRAFLLAEELQKRGIAVVVHTPAVETISETQWPKKLFCILAVIGSLFSIKKGDVVFLQRTVGNKYFFGILVGYVWLFKRKMIFDFDDAIYLHSACKTKLLTRMASAVFVCSSLLQEWALKYNKHVYVFHTSLNFELYNKFTKNYSTDSGPCSIGWIGKGEEHVENLKLVARVLQLLHTRGVPFRFLLIGAWKDKRIYELFAPFPAGMVELVDYADWKKIPEEIACFDIGLMPLVETTEWNRSRSCYKLFEYLAVGLATVSSRNGEILNVIRDGEQGFLAESDEEWVQQLERLCTDKALRARIGAAGQAYIRDHESYEVIVPKIIDCINSL